MGPYVFTTQSFIIGFIGVAIAWTIELCLTAFSERFDGTVTAVAAAAEKH